MKFLNCKVLFVSAFTLLAAVGCKPRTFNSTSDTESSSGSAAGRTVQARSNDVAQSYFLDNNGNLFRYVNGFKCQVTNDVSDFKVSAHPNDSAMIYYVRQNTLYVLHNVTEDNGQCPKSDKKAIMENVSKYKIVSTNNTTIVNMALDNSGHLVAWGDNNVLLASDGITDFSMNDCFNQSGMNFSHYAAFAINTSGNILKIEGNNPNSSKATTESYSSIQDFKSNPSLRVCQSASAPAPSDPAPSVPSTPSAPAEHE